MTDSYFPASNRTIMVVDDEIEMVKVVRGMLKEKGFNVTCAYDGLQVFYVLKQQKPDLIILDILMFIVVGVALSCSGRLSWVIRG